MAGVFKVRNSSSPVRDVSIILPSLNKLDGRTMDDPGNGDRLFYWQKLKTTNLILS